MAKSFAEVLEERVVVLDGAMGTSVQARHLNADDFGGTALEGCNEYLVISRPDVVADIHAAFLKAGCDGIETNTFGAGRVVLAEYGLADRAYEVNRRAAEIALQVARDFSTPD
ncbi:MAG TPA: homocysteine S-methyltransferase family protein, partial [Armatimonadota bacterium]